MTDDQVAPVQILLVEDSPGDVSLTREALRSARVANQLNAVGDGEAALRYLRGEGECVGSKAPIRLSSTSLSSFSQHRLPKGTYFVRTNCTRTRT
jgi:hypothetical protein